MRGENTAGVQSPVPSDAVALIDRSGEVSFGALHDRVARVQGALERCGVRRGDAVLVVTANDRHSVVAYLAVVALGATAVLSHVGAGAVELRVACEVTRPKLAILSPPAVELGVLLPDGIDVVAAEDLGGEPGRPAVPVDPDARRLIVFTSGTTSTPKGVVHTARSLQGAVACFQEMLGLTRHDRLFLVSPLASITGVLQALELAPSVGAAVVLEQQFSGGRSLDLLIAGGGTAFGGPDLVLDRLLTAAQRRGIGVPLRIAALGGTMLRQELMDKAERTFGIRVVRVYGSSEAPCSAGTRPDEPAALRLADEGVPGPGVELRLADDRELLVRGPNVFVGYADGDDEHSFLDGWFRTGDEAAITDGRLHIIGRFKDVVSRNGKKISLAEVDQAFTTASGITECAAFGVSDEQTGERVVIAVHVPDDAALDLPNVLATMEAGGLARWKLPESVVRVTEPLPTTATGKVLRRSLTEDRETLWRAERLRPEARGRPSTKSQGD